MKLLEFVEKYNNMANNTLKEQLLSKIKITPYISIIKKDTYAQLIVNRTMFEQEAYDDNGTTKYRKTDKIRINSVAQYVQFCRAVIELYTDLEIDEDDKGFIKGYDALKSSGLLDILMVGSDKADPLIPMSELSEFKTILTMKQSDTQFNETTTQAFISKQIGSLDVILGKVESIVRAEKEAGRGGKSMWDAIKEKAWYGAASAIGTYFGVNDIFRYGQQAVSTIVELDTALVDLKKTTSMSSSELENFYYDSNNVAKQMGVTTKEIIDQASAWSRLGYSSQEAATTMAKLSSKFASISPGMSTDEAQEGLVSIMKAFDIDPNDVETEIMDKVNILGNKFAEENQDVVEGLKRSSAAMAAMGQTFTDTAALFTGGMEILQDAESMGTALRTLSMRVRGYDEETEELSDDLVNVTGEVADLTKTAKDAQGVSLFTDATQEHYKSMVEYLGEISDRWDQISEKNQTELLQKLFGKNRANAGAAIIQNFDQVRSAIEAMDESAGSSDKEMSTIEQSLEYKINSLKETWVGTVQQMIDRGDIGKVVDALTKISESIGFVVDKLGLLKTTVLGVTAALSFKNVGRDKMYSPTCFEYADHIHNLLWIHRFRVC